MRRAGSILFYVQHLLGIGHLKRAACLARAMSEAGFRVTVVSGGMPVPGLDLGTASLVQLPPLRASDASFSGFVDQVGEPVSDAVLKARRILLTDTLETTAPDVVITEHFPFGRRKLRDEILDLLDKCRSQPQRPRVMASVRDILVPPSDPEQCVEWVASYYDAVLVHGDPAVAPFELSFPRANRFRWKVLYTGYVGERVAEPAEDQDRYEVVVSVGGGTEAKSLMDAALAARPLSAARNHPWRILLGADAPTTEFDARRALAAPGVVVEWFRPGVPELLSRARLSISRAGYNTMAEGICAGTRMVVVPFETEHETEQRARAEHFEARGLCRMVPQSDLDPERLARAIDASLAGPPPDRTLIQLDGARETAALLSHWLAEAPHERSA